MPSVQAHFIRGIFRIRRFINPPAGSLDVQKQRLDTEALARAFKTRVDATFTPVDANGIPAEWVHPPQAPEDRAMLYFHGGSYNCGSIASHRSLVTNIAHAARIRALIVDYRLAPEHPFPAAVADALTTYRWLLDNGFQPDRLIIAGDSCGGGLSLALLIRLQEEALPLPAAAVCLSPWTDLTCSGESWHTNARKDVMLDPYPLRDSARLYLGEVDPHTPLASPLYADLRGLPPLLIQAGSDELLLSDATSFAERAREAGVEVTLEIWQGMQHEWHFAADLLPEGRQAIQKIGEFVQKHI